MATLGTIELGGDALSKLDHPGICTVYDAGEIDDVPYLAMRYIEGESLAQRIGRTWLGSKERPHPIHS